ncbi:MULTISPECIES: DUF1840 domain-containing protein [Simplicispira]|jgi:hypothetical protein|uniref:Uncharacterized protein DUF1840 n=1 Tax=Simplicispira metamorpha TaxID=80881 RepID=A0A4R2N6C0_9BURK|nr:MULTISPECIES: DUF1840 domain-containing protein [Simplicispira]MBP7412456.1 DUF1840 domain-containing protein [Giesbergeria sp.]MDD2692740.1 DUF1840 domain-containing protein [Simplicispira sp.]TCP16450.1 uncharacterized protein DUF1840 [Simplicispira metamorpha]
MLYKFKSRSTADLILLEPQGRRLLQIIGKEPAARGIVTAAQIPAAISALEAAVAAEEQRIAQARADREAEGLSAEGEEDAQSDAVRLRQRAAPFIEMLRRSAAEDNDVVWGA